MGIRKGTLTHRALEVGGYNTAQLHTRTFFLDLRGIFQGSVKGGGAPSPPGAQRFGRKEEKKTVSRKERKKGLKMGT